MRQKRNVLVYCADVAAAEQMRWLLEVRCKFPFVRATSVSSVEGMIVAASAESFDCCVVYRSKLGGEPMSGGRGCADAQVYELLRMVAGGGVIVELMDGLAAAPYSIAHRHVAGDAGMAAAEIVDAVKSACARKRGPYQENDPRRGFTLADVVDRKVA